MKPNVAIFWFRRDLRLNDNAGLYHALKSGLPVLPIFIFDTCILDKLEDKTDKRVVFIHTAICNIQHQLLKLGSSLHVIYSTPKQAFEKLLTTYNIAAVYANKDYENYALERDGAIKNLIENNNGKFCTYKDQVIFEESEVVKDDGKPYTVFTPYSKKWKAALTRFYFKPYLTEKYFTNFYKQAQIEIPSLVSMGFEAMSKKEQEDFFPTNNLKDELVKKYTDQRNFPAINGTSRLGVHLRFGTVSIRQLVAKSIPLNETFLNELIWRDFYQCITFHFKHIGKGDAFRKEYDFIKWSNNEEHFHKWCIGQTGYPIVDAGMRELNTTGFMHNRVRMIVASFLTKHLLIDWRWGEAYFAKKLLDFDFSANNGGWQWAAGSGCDAAPYFRVFNPTLQTEKFDKQLQYVKKWVPEVNSFNYAKPIVVHEAARKRALEAYGKVLKKEIK